MQPLVDSAASTALLVIQAGPDAWALPSAAVASVEALGSRSTAEALDVLALLGLPAAGSEHAARVLVLAVPGGPLRVIARGTLTLRDVLASDLLALPSALRGSAPFVSHVAVVDGKPALFVVAPERLLGAAPSDSAPPPLPPTTPLEVPSC